MLTLNNPAGLWALLGIPVILFIHFLQRKSTVLPISTLFLLDQLHRESLSGRRIERLRSSIPLWLQLLAVFILTWILVQPRWLEKGSVQRITIVLDSSASMQPAKVRLLKELPVELRRLGRAVATTEYVVLDTVLEKESLYHGSVLADLESALDDWTPQHGSHDPQPALRLARGIAGPDGLVIFATDHPAKTLPFNARVFAVGEPIENVGFAGLTIEEKDGQLLWKATLKNFGKSPQTRKWWTEVDGKSAGSQSVLLDPGQSRAIQGLFPPSAPAVTVRCDPDKFPLDDALPLTLPEPKKLNLLLPSEAESSAAEAGLYEQLFSSLPDVAVTISSAAANVAVTHYDPLKPALPGKPAIIFVRDTREQLPALEGALLAEPQPLLEGLNWQSLLCLDSLRITARKSDEVLLWQGERPLIFLRGEGLARQLCFNFDLRRSNARKLSAFVILIHRFLESLRKEFPLHEARNVECAQKLTVACHTEADAAPVRLLWDDEGKEQVFTVPPAQVGLLTAPMRPGAFRVVQGEAELLRGAAHFADTREADFKDAGSQNDLMEAAATLTDRYSKEQTSWRLWVLGLLAALLASWWFVRQSVPEPKPDAAPAPLR